MAVIYKPLQKVWLQFEQYMNLLLFPPLPHHFLHIPSFGFKILWSFYLWRSVVPQILQVSLCMDGDRAAIVLPKLQCNAAAKGLLYLLGGNSCRLEIRAFHSSCWELWEGVVSLQNTAGGRNSEINRNSEISGALRSLPSKQGHSPEEGMSRFWFSCWFVTHQFGNHWSRYFGSFVYVEQGWTIYAAFGDPQFSSEGVPSVPRAYGSTWTVGACVGPQ